MSTSQSLCVCWCCLLDSPYVLCVLLLICCCMYVVPPQFRHRDFRVGSTVHTMHMNSLLNQWSKYLEIKILSTLFHSNSDRYISLTVYCTGVSDFLTANIKSIWERNHNVITCVKLWSVCAVLFCLMSVLRSLQQLQCVLKLCVSCLLLGLILVPHSRVIGEVVVQIHLSNCWAVPD